LSARVGGSARRRILIVVCDGLGVGAAPDADAYGDAGTDTLGHVLDRIPTALPNLESLGLLALLDPSRGGRAAGARGKAYELSGERTRRRVTGK
jgi:phosphopentomutase